MAISDSSLLLTRSALADAIDHTLLRPDATRDEVVRLCDEAGQYGFHAVCVAPAWAALAVERVRGSSVIVAAVVGFPHGNTFSRAKALETSEAGNIGAKEIDMVMHVGALRSGDDAGVLDDISAVVAAARKAGGLTVKVILETALLTREEKIRACQLAERAGANYVKTSTGFSTAGATVEDVLLMRRTVGNRLGVKAAGGIRDLKTALAMIEAGANRLGCSSSVAIMQQFDERPARDQRARKA